MCRPVASPAERGLKMQKTFKNLVISALVGAVVLSGAYLVAGDVSYKLALLDASAVQIYMVAVAASFSGLCLKQF